MSPFWIEIVLMLGLALALGTILLACVRLVWKELPREFVIGLFIICIVLSPFPYSHWARFYAPLEYTTWLME